MNRAAVVCVCFWYRMNRKSSSRGREAKRRSFTFTQLSSHWIAFASRKSFYEVRSSRTSTLLPSQFGRKSFTLLFIFCRVQRRIRGCGFATEIEKKCVVKGFEQNCPESAFSMDMPGVTYCWFRLGSRELQYNTNFMQCSSKFLNRNRLFSFWRGLKIQSDFIFFFSNSI